MGKDLHSVYDIISDIDDCGPANPCENGATCHGDMNAVTCACVPGFTGDACQTGVLSLAVYTKHNHSSDIILNIDNCGPGIPVPWVCDAMFYI